MTTAALTSIELDTTIQCRADIDIATVNEYAEHMAEGAVFPPVVLFGTEHKSWIGDGWHRVMAARSLGLAEIEADLRCGGRLDALKYALAANATHGRPRTNKDKRATVAIALREWGKLSDRSIAEMCAVSDPFVGALRRALYSTANDLQFARTVGRDGKERPATREPKAAPTTPTEQPKQEDTYRPEPRPVVGPPCVGMQFARIALMKLAEIRDEDLEREQAFDHVVEWIAKRRAGQ